MPLTPYEGRVREPARALKEVLELLKKLLISPRIFVKGMTELPCNYFDFLGPIKAVNVFEWTEYEVMRKHPYINILEAQIEEIGV